MENYQYLSYSRSVLKQIGALSLINLKEQTGRKTSSETFEKYCFRLPIVIPAEAGIQCFQVVLDPGFRRGDGKA